MNMITLNKLLDYIRKMARAMFTGNITIHFNQGNICKVDRHESLKKL